MGGALSCKKKSLYFKPQSYPYTQNLYNPLNPHKKSLPMDYLNRDRNMIKQHNFKLYHMANPETETDISEMMSYIKELSYNEIYDGLIDVLHGFRYIPIFDKEHTEDFLGDYVFVNMIGLILMQNNRKFDINLVLHNLLSLDKSILNSSCIAVINPHTNRTYSGSINNTESQYSYLNITPMLLAFKHKFEPSTIGILLNNRTDELFYLLNKTINLYPNYDINKRPELVLLIKNIFQKIGETIEISVKKHSLNIYRDKINKYRNLISNFDVVDTASLIDSLCTLDEHLLEMGYNKVIYNILKTSTIKTLCIRDLKTAECSICLDNYTEITNEREFYKSIALEDETINIKYMGITNCGHFLCDKCFNSLSKYECPICNTELHKNAIIYYE